MISLRSLRSLRVAIPVLWAMMFAATASLAQTPPAPIYEPEYSQPGKDVVWVPTPEMMVDTMLDLAKVTPDDYVIDLGSGDGRLVIGAATRGARALGVEYDDNLVRYSLREAEKRGVTQKAQFIKADIFTTDFSQATVLTLFLLPEMNLRLRPQFLAMKPGTRIVANYFRIGDWSPDEEVRLPESEKCRSYCVAYLWIVPANVAGAWHTPQGELTLTQNHQHVNGTLGAQPVLQGRVRGDTLNFAVDGVSYSGRISEGVIDGMVSNEGAATRWRATRQAR